MNDNYIHKKIFNDSKSIINKKIHLFLYNLFIYIFIKRPPPKTAKVKPILEDYIKKINVKIIKDKNQFINTEYSKNNFTNIVLFVKSQNKKNAGEILESILIYVFSLAFYSNKDNTLGEYIFNNISKLIDSTNYEIVKMFKEEKFIPEELKDLKNLLKYDLQWEDRFNNQNLSQLQDESPLCNLLFYIFIEKYIYLKYLSNNNKAMLYIYRGKSNNKKISDAIYQDLKDKSTTILDKDITSNSIMSIVQNLFFPIKSGKESQINIRLVRALLIEVFIYYQNKNSPLMNYILNDKEYDKIPFNYDLRGACVEGKFAFIILSPLRLEPRIERIMFSQNNLRECGQSEIGKVVLFNKNIKIIEFNTSLLRTNYIEFFNNALGIFDNYSLDTLNISFNYLKENCEDYLAKLMTHFKELKSLNLTANELKGGLAPFFVVLKKLYRNGQSKLENLIINKCLLDDASYYELGELLNCKYCRLKKLFLNSNNMPVNINFLKKIKKNKSLVEIFLNKNEICNNIVYDLMKLISNSEIRYLYLFKNKIRNFNDFLRLLYRTKLIKEKNIDNIIGDESFLVNLDLSNNEVLFKNSTQIILLKNIIKETNLQCLDISHILHGANPDKKKINNSNINYRKKIDELMSYLENEKSRHIKTIHNIRKNKVDIDRNKEIKDINILKTIKDNDIYNIITNEKAKFFPYLKDQAKNIINDK